MIGINTDYPNSPKIALILKTNMCIDKGNYERLVEVDL